MQNSVDKLNSIVKIKQAKNELEPYLKTPEIIDKAFSDCDSFQFFSTKPIKTNEEVDPVLNDLKKMGIIKDKKSFMTLPGSGAVMLNFQQENKSKVEIVKDFIKVLDWKVQKLTEPADIPNPNPGGDDPNKTPNQEPPKDRKPKSGELCEQCGASCIVHQTKTSYTIKRKRYIKHKTDFTREETC
jgi:hypothetical protein